LISIASFPPTLCLSVFPVMLTRVITNLSLAILIPLQGIFVIYFGLQDPAYPDLRSLFLIGTGVTSTLFLIVLTVASTLKSGRLFTQMRGIVWFILHSLSMCFCIVYPVVVWVTLPAAPNPTKTEVDMFWVWGGLLMMMGVSSVFLWIK